MPTGYTAGLVEGKDSFEEFVWGCTRAFGVRMHMRDDPPYKTFDVPGDWLKEGNPHKDWLVECATKLREFVEMPRVKQVNQVRANLEKGIASDERILSETQEENSRINAAIAKASLIDTPSKHHIRFMEFIKEQLETSLDDTEYLHQSISRNREKLNDIESAVDEYIELLRGRVKQAESEVARWDHMNEERLPRQEWLRSLNKVVPCPAHMATEEFLEWIK